MDEVIAQVQCYCSVDSRGHLWDTEVCPSLPVDQHDDHESPEHFVIGGELRGWSASDLTDDELVDDEWIRQNTRQVE